MRAKWCGGARLKATAAPTSVLPAADGYFGGRGELRGPMGFSETSDLTELEPACSQRPYIRVNVETRTSRWSSIRTPSSEGWTRVQLWSGNLGYYMP